MQYLLDSNAVIALLKAPDGPVHARLLQHSPSDVFVSVVVLHELFYGAFKSVRREANLRLVDSLQFGVLPLEVDDARHAGELRAGLSIAGTPIGAYDVLIAGQARARGMVLVSRNRREFDRVPGLRVEDWESSSPTV